MYSISATQYDQCHEIKNYQQEAGEIAKLIKSIHPKAKSVLDVACGTGEHNRYLCKKFLVDGLDMNRKFLAAARKKNPNGRYYYADMRQFELRKKYDVITCLYASIGFAKTLASLQRTIRCFEKHLKDDGAIIVHPWNTPSEWKKYKFDRKVYPLTTESENTKIGLINTGIRSGLLTLIETHYLIGTSKGIRHISEKHDLGLFTIREMKTAFKKANLKVTYEDNGITKIKFYIARRYN